MGGINVDNEIARTLWHLVAGGMMLAAAYVKVKVRDLDRIQRSCVHEITRCRKRISELEKRFPQEDGKANSFGSP